MLHTRSTITDILIFAFIVITVMGYKVNIMETNKRQVTVTVPRQIADLLELKKGQQVEWTLGKGRTLELRL